MASRRVALALQGGGAHSAFTWGVLDRLLEQQNLEITAVSATSGGALNGAALASGLARGSREEARALLETVWRVNAEAAAATNPFTTASEWVHREAAPEAAAAIARASDWNIDDGFLAAFTDFWSRQTAPVSFGSDVLRRVIEAALPNLKSDLALKHGPELFVCATNVRTNRRQIFYRSEVDSNVLRASACLPNLFPTVFIAGEPYWDGGYIGNPALQPLFDDEFRDSGWAPSRPVPKSDDLLVIRVNPFERDNLNFLKTAHGIDARLNEIAFNASIILEVAAIQTINKIVAEIGDRKIRYRQIRLHEIGADSYMAALGVASKLNPYGPFLEDLFTVGRDSADKWLNDPKKAGLIGKESSWNIEGEIKSCFLSAQP